MKLAADVNDCIAMAAGCFKSWITVRSLMYRFSIAGVHKSPNRTGSLLKRYSWRMAVIGALALIAGCGGRATSDEEAPLTPRPFSSAEILEDWDRSVSRLERILSDPTSKPKLPEMAARLRLVNARLSENRAEADKAYKVLLERRLREIHSERGGAVVGSAAAFTALQDRLDIEELRIRSELEVMNR